MNTDQQLPRHAPEVEQAVLGALLVDRSAWLRVLDVLRPTSFYLDANRMIFQAGMALWNASKPVDIVTVTERLRQDDHLQAVGGAYYVSTLASKVTSSANLDYHARILVEHEISREICRISHEGYQGGINPQRDAFELLDATSVAFSDLYRVVQGDAKITAATDLQALTDGKPPKLYTYGIEALDRVASIHPGKVHTFAGRPGMGKSVFACEVAWHLTQYGPVKLFSPEMTLTQVQARIVASESGVSFGQIIKRRMDEADLKRVLETIERIADRMAMVHVDPTPSITPRQVRARVERDMKQHGIVAVVVDHLHEMTTGDTKIDMHEGGRASACIAGLNEVAKNTDLPFLVMAQLNREADKRTDRRPKMSDLKWSGKIEEVSELVGLLYRDGYYQDPPPYEDTLEINVGKYRDGAVGVVSCGITPALSRIGPAPSQLPRPTTPPVDEAAPF